MTTENSERIRETVREHYARIAVNEPECGCGSTCCGGGEAGSLELGYSMEDLKAVPEGADLGLGCGNPQTIAGLRPGETVLDLGSGGGLDCFLAARQVGRSGHVIGVDMTAEMVAKARAAALRTNSDNVEFRLGEIEHLPVEDSSVDVVMSNCVINLSPDKAQVFRECLRVLRPGGRLAISDVVMIAELPESLRDRADTLAGCVAGAASVRQVETTLADAGFEEVRVHVQAESRAIVAGWFPGSGIERYVASGTIEASKPANACCGSRCS
jgi:arsenite methyltransferase